MEHLLFALTGGPSASRYTPVPSLPVTAVSPSVSHTPPHVAVRSPGAQVTPHACHPP
jgi:hypothetical protein